MGFNYLIATKSLPGDNLIFATTFPGAPGTELIDFGRMKG